MDLVKRISVDPAICHGKPCIRGHRVPVAVILDALSDGETVDEVLAEYPSLERDDVMACIAYAADMARGRLVDVPPGAVG